MTRRRVRALCIVAVCLLGQVSLSLAQGALPAAIVQATTLTPDQIAQVEQYVRDPINDLGNPEAAAITKARDALLAPLKEPGVSIAFRQKYSELINSKLREYAANERDVVATNALRVVGELATPEAVGVLTERLGDKRDSIRLFTAMEAGRVFRMLRPIGQQGAPPAVSAEELNHLVDQVGQRVVAETQGDVLDADSRALIEAAKANRAGFESVRHSAVLTLCKQVIARRAKLPGWPNAAPFLPAFLRVQTFLRDVQGPNEMGLDLSHPAEDLAVIEMQGHMLAWVVTHLKEFPQGDTAAREVATQIVRVAETACVVGAGKFDVQIASQKLADDFKKATAEGDRAFFGNALNLFDSLRGPPFNLGPFMVK